MLDRLFSSKIQPEYGVTVPIYGTPDPGTTSFFIVLLKYALLPLVIPLVLTIGVLVYMSKKGYPVSKRIWAIAIMLAIYFAVFLVLAFGLKWF